MSSGGFDHPLPFHHVPMRGREIGNNNIGKAFILYKQLSQPESRQEGEPKRKTGLKRDLESPP